MRLILRQSFPLGRFHATPWRVSPFDDPFGEWPPSPWRFVRAVVARWYQWSRESAASADLTQLDALVRALCESSYSFYLPAHAMRGSPLRQYHPVEFGWVPPAKKGKPIPRMKAYGTILVQDNYWSVPTGDDGAVWWFLDGDAWTPQLIEVLDQCIERLIYFGRAETFTTVKRDDSSALRPNCEPRDQLCSPASVRVLCPQRNASRADVERITDDPQSSGRTIPPGSKLMYADIPPRVPVRERPVIFVPRTDCHLIQLAVGWSVTPEPRAIVRLTARYRSAVIRELLDIKTEGQHHSWRTAPKSIRSAIADMLGKDANGVPFKEHSHTEFLSWWHDGAPTRLLVWRGSRSFSADEQRAVLRAAARELSWAAMGPDADAWKIRLIPLDAAVPAPPGFDATSATAWESLTPYVPPRHHLRGGKPREAESLTIQVRRELTLRGTPGGEQVEVEETSGATWVAVHVPRRKDVGRTFLGDRRGYWLRLTFPDPVTGPLRLGHSSSFGLGLFKPANPSADGR